MAQRMQFRVRRGAKEQRSVAMQARDDDSVSCNALLKAFSIETAKLSTHGKETMAEILTS
jgi:hypothetical protein